MHDVRMGKVYVDSCLQTLDELVIRFGDQGQEVSHCGWASEIDSPMFFSLSSMQNKR